MFKSISLTSMVRLATAIFVFSAACVLPARAATTPEAKTPILELSADAIAMLKSVKEIEKDFYTVDCTIDYALDELLEKGVEDSKTLEAFISEKLMDGLPFNFETIHLACSSFAAEMDNGDFIQGRNMDLSYAKNFMVHTKPEKGYESLSMVSGHLLGYTDSYPTGMLGRLWTLSVPYFPIDGINEKGLSVALLMLGDRVVRQDRGKPPITTTLMIRMILDKAATVNEAIELMDRYDMRSIANASFHFHLVDATGDSAVVEYVDEKMQVIRRSGYGQPVTNYYLTPGMYDVIHDGQERVDTLQKALDASKGVVSKKQAWDMLESIKMVHDLDEATGIDFMTAYSMIYNNSKRTVDICIDAKFDKVYRYSLDGWGRKVLALKLDADAVATLGSIKKVEDEFYTIDYKGDYALDEALEKGIESPSALDAFVSEKELDGLPFNFETIRLACSTFAAELPEGDRILARNMDLSYSKNFLVHTKPSNGYESLSMTIGHLLGYTGTFPDSNVGRLWTLAAPYYPIDGINEKGLSVAILLIADKVVKQDTGKPPITTTLAVRMLLDKAATVDEALELMAGHDMRSMGNTNIHFHITDAAGNSAVVEYVDEKMSVVRPTGYGQAVTNYYLTPGMENVIQDGQDRMEKLEKALNDNRGVVSKDQAWSMLDSVKAVHDYDEENDIDFMTAYSILFNNNKRSMDICIDAKFGKVYSYSLAGWGK